MAWLLACGRKFGLNCHCLCFDPVVHVPGNWQPILWYRQIQEHHKMDVVQCQGLSSQLVATIASPVNHLADIPFCFHSPVQVLPVLFVLLVIVAIWHLGWMQCRLTGFL